MAIIPLIPKTLAKALPIAIPLTPTTNGSQTHTLAHLPIDSRPCLLDPSIATTLAKLRLGGSKTGLTFSFATLRFPMVPANWEGQNITDAIASPTTSHLLLLYPSKMTTKVAFWLVMNSMIQKHLPVGFTKTSKRCALLFTVKTQ